MKLFLYGVNDDEFIEVQKFQKQHPNVELSWSKRHLTMDTVDFAKNFKGISIAAAHPISAPIFKQLKQNGVEVLSTRSVGYDYLDLAAAKKVAIKLAYVPDYSPETIAEYTIMLMLNILRKTKKTLSNIQAYNFSRKGLIGDTIQGKTIGIVGAGRIGQHVIQILSSMHVKILVYAQHQTKNMEQTITFVETLDEIYELADIISLHIPGTIKNYHLLNKQAFDMMKRKPIIINTGRGSLIDTVALLEALKNESIRGAGLDVLEEEGEIFGSVQDQHHVAESIKELIALPQVIITPHNAFNSKIAVQRMIFESLQSIIDIIETGESNQEIKL